jgi:AcrR family transcriptional regulator
VSLKEQPSKPSGAAVAPAPKPRRAAKATARAAGAETSRVQGKVEARAAVALPSARPRATVRGRTPPGDPAPMTLCDAAGPELCRQWRAPQHERGRRRVDAILDAASALLVEGGLAALSVDAVAKRSGTSKSSMYHFFPDRDAIVRALADRHVATITDYEGFGAADASAWARLTVEETVDRYLEPFVRYVTEHPDVLPCMRAAARVAGDTAAEAVLDAMALERAERVIGARQPGAKPAERRARAATLYAITVGTMEVLSRLRGGPPRATALRELREVLIAYLVRLEPRSAAQGARRGAEHGRASSR